MDHKPRVESYKAIQKDFAKIRMDRSATRHIDQSRLLTLDLYKRAVHGGKAITLQVGAGKVEYSASQIRKYGQARRKFVRKYQKGATIKALLKKCDSETLQSSRKQIKTGNVSRMQGDLVIIYTGKTQNSTFAKPKHTCRIELKDFDRILHKAGPDYRKMTLGILGGPIGVFCDCEDYQFRRAYWATQINAYTRDYKETAFTKITNPKGDKGPICIHLVKALRLLATPMGISIVERSVKANAKKIDPNVEKGAKISKKEQEKFAKLEKEVEAHLDKQGKLMLAQFTKASKAYETHRKKMLSSLVKTKKSLQGEVVRLKKEKLAMVKGMVKEGLTIETAAKIAQVNVDVAKKALGK
jgi:hypothetical protein